MPGRPTLRSARAMSRAMPGISDAARPTTTGRSRSSITALAAPAAYVQPVPSWPPPCAVATTIVVLFQASVPSASGASVGIV
jgi:hypothetical protein